MTKTALHKSYANDQDTTQKIGTLKTPRNSLYTRSFLSTPEENKGAETTQLQETRLYTFKSFPISLYKLLRLMQSEPHSKSFVFSSSCSSNFASNLS